jgi:hypothetical protein
MAVDPPKVLMLLAALYSSRGRAVMAPVDTCHWPHQSVLLQFQFHAHLAFRSAA